jgi:tetratricopeptide (TPR) repeat protein
MPQIDPSASADRKPASRWGRRRRRIAWSAGILLSAGAVGGLFAWKNYLDNRPEEYRPGEASADITESITEKGNLKAPADERFRTEHRSRRTDALREIGRKLPPGAPPPLFTDVTKKAGLGSFVTFAGQRTSQLPEDMGSGAAWGDFDNDGFEDVFIVSAGGPLTAKPGELAESMLFRNRGDGTFERVRDFPEVRIMGMGAAWGDYDNDGWLDLVVTGYDKILLFHNEHGKFVLDTRMPSPKGFWTGVSWGDYNRDGYLDLYICGYVKYVVNRERGGGSTRQFGLEVPYTLNPSSFEPERNLLLRNNRNGTFTDVARQAGVDNPAGRSLSALWHDFDGDGWLDLYVANDISENKLYLNRQGKFEDAGAAAWIAEYRGSMGLAMGDFDRDGDDDLFISHWIAQQYALYQSLESENRKAGIDTRQLHYTDVAEPLGIGPPSLQKIGWGAAFVDVDSDGWLDLLVANGSTFETKDPPRNLVPMESFLFWNDRGRFFHDLAPWNQSLSTPHVSRGLAVADYDNDGAMDVLLVDHDGGARLLRNDVPHGNWIEFRLRSLAGPQRAPIGFADGARLVAHAGGMDLRATISSASYLSQDSRRVHYGLGAAGKVDRLDVIWPDGQKQSWADIDANRIWDLVEGAAAPQPFGTVPVATAPALTKAQQVEFWDKERAAMDAIKRSSDPARAAQLFREALAINPVHEDSRYYLANCLAAMGDSSGAIRELDTLTRINPQSHRAWLRRGSLMASAASSRSQLAPAAESVRRALALNPEETGALLLLGGIAIANGDLSGADRDLQLALRSNPRSVAALYLRAYIAARRKDATQATTLLTAARAARGPDWKPVGSVAEGDVKDRMKSDAAFLSQSWETWDGVADPARAFATLDSLLARLK